MNTHAFEQPAKLQEFLDFFTINVSEFFRIPEKFEYLKGTSFQKSWLGRESEFGALDAPTVGALFLAMMLEDMVPNGRWSVLATDVDRSILKKAQRVKGTLRRIFAM